MKNFLQFLSTPETWPDWLAFAAVAVMMNILALVYLWAWDANFPA